MTVIYIIDLQCIYLCIEKLPAASVTNDLSPEVTIVQLHNSDLSMDVTSEHLTPEVTVNNDVTMVTDEIMFATGEIDKHLIGNIVFFSCIQPMSNIAL